MYNLTRLEDSNNVRKLFMRNRKEQTHQRFKIQSYNIILILTIFIYRRIMDTEAENEDKRLFKIWFQINEQTPIMISGLKTTTYARVKNNDKYAYKFFMKCVKSGKIINNEPIEILHKSIDVDYTRVEYMLPDENKTKLKVTYNYQGEFYEVVESNETHSKLQTDENFFAEYFQIQKAREKNIVQQGNLDESSCSQTNPHHTIN